MRFFNIDLHVAVIGDIKQIFTELGHTVDTKSLSDHSWVLGQAKSQVDVIGPNWSAISKPLCDKFYERYKDELSGYDAFIATYPPCFAMLYEKFNKPIIVDAAIRYEHPFHDTPRWIELNNFFQRMIDQKRLHLVANSKYDQKYCETLLNRPVTHIPNLCDYTGIKYKPNNGEIVYYSKNHIQNIGLRAKTEVLKHRYGYPELLQFKALVHVPYQVSTMSIFEQYTANFPLLFPTPDFNMELYARGLTLTEVSWRKYFGLPPKTPFLSIASDPNDYTNPKAVKEWLLLADYYDHKWMPYITYYSSWADLQEQIKKLDVHKISSQMQECNKERQKQVKKLWSDILEKL